MLLKAGDYYLGDLCYVLSDEDYCSLLKNSGFLDNRILWEGELNGYPVFVACTSHGDGVYFDNYDRQYFVDAGIIGIVPADILVSTSKVELGNIIRFETDFKVSYDNGIFKFGDIVIDTENFGIGAMLKSFIKEERDKDNL